MLPLTIIGGYLGAGKTTVVNHLLRNADGVRLAILVNEFGALPIDEDLIEAQDEDIIGIAGGCVCCSYGNDLTLALMDLTKLDPPPDHVLLEASGVALPGAIAASVSLLQGYALDGIVVLANAETVQEQAVDTYIGDTIERQIADADLIVLNKTDVIAPSEQNAVSDWMRAKAPDAEVIPASHGALPPAVLLQSFLGRERIAAKAPEHQPDLYVTRALAINAPCDAERLARELASEDLGLLRAKGFVKTTGGTRKLVQVVGRRWTVTDTPADTSLGVVVIGRKQTFNEDALDRVVRGATLDA